MNNFQGRCFKWWHGSRHIYDKEYLGLMPNMEHIHSDSNFNKRLHRFSPCNSIKYFPFFSHPSYLTSKHNPVDVIGKRIAQNFTSRSRNWSYINYLNCISVISICQLSFVYNLNEKYSHPSYLSTYFKGYHLKFRSQHMVFNP